MKYLAILSLIIVSSCSWTERNANSMMDWANETMPTYDGSRPGLTAKPEAGAPTLPGYQGTTISPESTMRPPVAKAPGTIPAPQTNSAVPAPHNFNSATSPGSMPHQPDYYDPMVPQPPI